MFFMAKEKNRYITIGICIVIAIMAIFNNVKVCQENYDESNGKQIEYLEKNLQSGDIIIYKEIGQGGVVAVQTQDYKQYFVNLYNWSIEEAYKAYGPGMETIYNYEDILKPMSLRTNASEIIRTWDFYTIVKSFYHFGQRPWNNVMISGFVMAGKGEKISKSKDNSKVEPLNLINQYSADVIRYWAGSGRLGTDMIFSEETLLNAGLAFQTATDFHTKTPMGKEA